MSLAALGERRTASVLSRLVAREKAVIDVGSNSVRLVIFRVEGRAFTQVLNEKTLAGLGRGLGETGRLWPAGVAQAISALKRFRLLLEALGVSDVIAVATAAVRDAADGEAFVAAAERETGFRLRVLTGAEEAQAAADGVLGGAPGAVGVVGDLGGSSLELIAVDETGAHEGETHKLGPLAIGRLEPFDAAHAATIVNQSLAGSRVLAERRGGAFYAVGGAWRGLGHIDMALRDYPLKILHNYTISRIDALELSAFVQRQSRRSLEKLEGATGRRAEMLPYAALLLGSLMEAGGFDQIVISSYGLREGLLWQALSPAERALDPLVTGAAVLAGRDARARAFGDALEAWIAPVFSGFPDLFGPGRAAILRQAACQLADIGAVLHPDHRADLAFNLVLRAPFGGANHVERVFLAAATYYRYSHRGSPEPRALIQKLLDEDRQARARALGAAMRLGADLSGRSAALLHQCTLSVQNGRLRLSGAPSAAAIATETVAKRLDQLGEVLGLKGQLAFG
jgi:exopolyphosphatase/guanosine-5'-triphosphate,3'-diphosphate pyrophosphatase